MENFNLKNKLETNEIPNIKEGVDFVFETNPELEQIGTREQYVEYLEILFPESKIKEIMYHGTATKQKIENFDFEKSNFANAVFFTSDKKFAEDFAFDEVRDGSVQEQVLNITNPFNYNNKEQLQELRPIIQQLVNEGYESQTGITFKNNLNSITIGERTVKNPTIDDFVDHYMWRLEHGSWRIIETPKVIDFLSQKYDSIIINEKGRENVAVFNTNQIHVLGSQSDIENFKKFVENKNTM